MANEEPQVTCTQKTSDGYCGKCATAMMHWPGRESIPVCEEHKKKAVRIGNAMGFCVYFTDVSTGPQAHKGNP